MRWWMRASGRIRLALVASLVVVLAAGAVATQSIRWASSDAERSHPSSTARAPEAASDARPTAKPLERGTFARISPDYRVAVTDVTLHQGANQRILVATVKAQYIGKKDGDLWADLTAQFIRADGRAFDESGCGVVGGGDASADPPPMAKGDTEDYTVCMEVPTSQTDGGRISVEEAFVKGDRASWSTSGAITKAMPAPKPTVAQTIAPQPPTQPHSGNQDNSDGYDSGDIKKYRHDLDDAIGKYEKQRDQIKAQLSAWKQMGYDGDAVGKYEDWLNDVERAIDYYKQQRDKLPN
ncbi:MAG: hypothetical protein ACJ71Z_10910 [Aeromicrobium sp.]